MSASKKKRLGSQRRSLNAQESPETSDNKASSPSVPQGRQRADVKTDLTLSPDSAQSETSARKKKLGSQRGNKGKQQFKDVTTESSHKPIEEVEGSTASGIKIEGNDESLEKNIESAFPESQAAGSDLVLNDASNVSLSAIPEEMSQKIDILDTAMDTTSELLLKVAQSEKYLTEITSTEEGVLSEKDQAKQMPDIFEATTPVGVTGESTCSVRLTEGEEIKATGSHDHNNKLNTEDKAGPVEKPVRQESDTSSLPAVKSRKMGSSRRKKVISDINDEDNEMAIKSNILTTLDTTGLTIVDTQEVNTSATGVTYKEEGLVEIDLAIKINEDKIDADDLSDLANANLSEVKEFEEAHVENVLVKMKARGDKIEESKLSDEHETNEEITNQDFLKTTEFALTMKGGPHPKDDEDSFDYFATGEEKEKEDEALVSYNLSREVVSELESDKFPGSELQLTKDETISEQSEPMFSVQPGIHPPAESLLYFDKNEEYNLISDSTVDLVDQAASSSGRVTPEDSSSESVDSKSISIIEQPETLISFLDEESAVPAQVYKDKDLDKDEQLEQEPFDFFLPVPQSADNVPLAIPDISVNDVEEAKILEIEEISSQPVCDESLQHHDETAEENTTEEPLNTSAAAVIQEPIIESDIYLKEDTNFDFYQHEQDSESDKSSVSKDMDESSSESISSTKDETVEPMFGALQEQDKPKLVFKTNSEDVENIDFLGQRSEPPLSFTDIVNTDSSELYKEEDQEEVKLSDEKLGDLQKDMSSEPESLLNPNAPLSSSFSDNTAYVDDVTPALDVQDKILEVSPNALSTENETLSSVDVQTDEQSEPIKIDNAVVAEVRELSSSNKEIELDLMKEKIPEVESKMLGLDENVSKMVEDEISQPTKTFTSDDFVLSEVDKDENQQRDTSSDLFTAQIPDTGDINATLATTQSDATASVEDGSAVAPQLTGNRRKLGSSRRIKERRRDNDEPKQEEINIMPEGEVAKTKVESEIEEKSQEITTDNEVVAKEAQVEPVQRPEKAIDNETQAAVQDETAVDSPHRQERQETATEPKDNTEQNDVDSESYMLKEAINVHQLTYISDSDTHEEMDNFSLQAKQPVLEETVMEPSDTVKLVNTSDSDVQHGLRTKPEDTEVFLLSGKDQTVDSTQEKEIQSQVVSLEGKTIDIQKEIPEVDGDPFTIKDLKDEGIVETEGLPRAVGEADTSSQSVAGSEEMISAKIDYAVETEQEGIRVMEVSETNATLQTSSEPKKRKMGSTRRSQLNRKQQDSETNAEDNASILEKAPIDENAPTVSEEDVQPLASDNSVNQEETTVAAGSVKDQHQSQESTERGEVTQEDKGEILQTEAELVEEIEKGVTTQTLLPVAEEIQPSSPGKRRKMGSTRKNLSSKRESPQEETVTPVNVEREEAASASNDNNESKEHSGLLAYTATVHQLPPDEETPLSQQDSQEELKSESKEAELSSLREAMAEDAAVARRRKMGSHRKPHSDQSIIQRRVTDSEEGLIHPLGEQRAESPKLSQKSEGNEGDNKASSSATAFNIKLDSRPAGERKSQQLPPTSTTFRWSQESNLRISAGPDRRYEVVMIGDSSVGKTSFIQRAQSGKFSYSDVPASIGMDSYKWTVVVNGRSIVLHLWDTAGQERFRSMTKQIFHRAQAFLLMYDVTCVETFAAASYWANCIKEGAAENVVVLLLGNKSDRKERKVSTEDGEIFAEENGFAFMECSAATGENVIEALETVARLLSQKVDTSRSEDPLLLRKPEPKNKLGCC